MVAVVRAEYVWVSRTVRLDFKGKANDIYLALSKRPLTTTDIFYVQ